VILHAAWRRSPDWLGAAGFKGVLLAALAMASTGLMLEVQSRLPLVYGALSPPQWKDYVYAAGSVGGLLPIAVLLWLAACSRFTYAAGPIAGGVLALSIAAWDARTPWPRFIEQASAANPFRGALAPGSQVYWPGSNGRTWLVLGAPTWISDDQGAGIVFNRQTALEYAERKRASAALQSSIENCARVEQPDCRIDLVPARELCVRNDGPDYLVLNARIDGYRSTEWRLPPEIGPGRQSLFLYDCRAFGAKEKGRR